MAPLVRHFYKNAEAFLQALPLAAGTEPDLFSEYGGTDHESVERDEDPAVTDIEQVPTRENIPTLRADNRPSEGNSTTDKVNENAQRTMESCSKGVDHPSNAFRATGGHDSCKSNKEDRFPHSRAQNSTPPLSDGFEAGVEPSIVHTPPNGGGSISSDLTNVGSKLQAHRGQSIQPQQRETSSTMASATFSQERPGQEGGYPNAPGFPLDGLIPYEKQHAVVRSLSTNAKLKLLNGKIIVSADKKAQEGRQRDRHCDDEDNESPGETGEKEEDTLDEDADENRDKEGQEQEQQQQQQEEEEEEEEEVKEDKRSNLGHVHNH
jgi:hypothetical protein